MRPTAVLPCLMAIVLTCATELLWAATNETVEVAAREKDDPQHNASDVEGHFTKTPTADKDEIHVTEPENVKGLKPGVYPDPVNDGAWLRMTQAEGPVKVDVEGREGIGAMYWVLVHLKGGTGRLGGWRWADVEDMKTPGALVMKDKKSGRGKSDETDDTSGTPILYAAASEDGKGDIEFCLNAESGAYDWTLRQSTTALASGTLSGPSFQSDVLDLPAGAYSLEVTRPGDADFLRRIDLVVIRLDLAVWSSGGDLDCGQADGRVIGPEVKEEDEESSGAYLLVNWDQDDGDPSVIVSFPDLNKVTSYTTFGEVANEDNLAKVVPTLNSAESLPSSGGLRLEVAAENTQVRFYTLPTKGRRLQFDQYPEGSRTYIWSLSDPDARKSLQTAMAEGIWMEGIAASSQERDVVMRLSYWSPDDEMICEDEVRATVVMIHLGNAVYREAALPGYWERCHAALVYSFDGSASAIGFKDPKNYGVMQLPPLNPRLETEKLDGMTKAPGLEYWYCYTNTSDIPDTPAGYAKRLDILKVAHWVSTNWTYNYSAFKCMVPHGDTWDGSLSDVKELRCDGLVELAYEYNGIMAWGKKAANGTVNYDMRVPPYLVEHSDWQFGDDPEDWDADMYATMLPATQGGFADAYISEHYPEYSGPAFKGNKWDTKLVEQRLCVPNVLSPESHAH